MKLWTLLALLTCAVATQAKEIQICFEAESAAMIKPSLRKIMPGPSPSYSGTGFVDIPPKAPKNIGSATYKICAPLPGKYFVWARMFCGVGLGKSILMTVNGSPRPVVMDGTYGKWHWVGSWMPARLKAGANTIVLLNRYTGVKVDQLLLTNSGTFSPTNIRPITQDGVTGNLIVPTPAPAAAR